MSIQQTLLAAFGIPEPNVGAKLDTHEGARDQALIADASGQTPDEHRFLLDNADLLRHTSADTTKARVGIVGALIKAMPQWLYVVLLVVVVLLLILAVIPGAVVLSEALDPADAKYRVLVLVVLVGSVFALRYVILWL
jgi:hypothetical protein